MLIHPWALIWDTTVSGTLLRYALPIRSWNYYAYVHVHVQCNMYVSIPCTCIPTPTGSVATGKKEVVFSGHRKGVEGVVGHRGHVMALAVSSDGKFLVSETHHMNFVHTCGSMIS